ncbi:MAG: hypothetical protein WCS37_05205 [Chloroflexota bacterium]|nr:hypothetical protein [Chloroflexota bacterium]
MAKDNISTRLEQFKEPIQPTIEGQEELACALCYRSFPAKELMVASKERFNFEAAVVVCPDCLEQLQVEMKEKSGGADLVLALIWGVLGLLIVTVPLSLMIWFNYTWPDRELWLWLGCYLAFLPGFVIGRAVYYGSGSKHSLKQQLLAVVLTLVCTQLITYVAKQAAINFEMDIIYKNGHAVELLNPFSYFFNFFLDSILNFKTSQLALAGIVFGLLIGLVVAWLASAGPQLFTRPFVTPISKKNNSGKK